MDKFIITIDKIENARSVYHDRIEAFDLVSLLEHLPTIISRLVKKEREIEIQKMMDTYIPF